MAFRRKSFARVRRRRPMGRKRYSSQPRRRTRAPLRIGYRM